MISKKSKYIFKITDQLKANNPKFKNKKSKTLSLNKKKRLGKFAKSMDLWPKLKKQFLKKKKNRYKNMSNKLIEK